MIAVDDYYQSGDTFRQISSDFTKMGYAPKNIFAYFGSDRGGGNLILDFEENHLDFERLVSEINSL